MEGDRGPSVRWFIRPPASGAPHQHHHRRRTRYAPNAREVNVIPIRSAAKSMDDDSIHKALFFAAATITLNGGHYNSQVK